MEREEITTTDLSKFGARERRIAEDLFRAWREHGLPIDFMDDGVTIMMNRNSGNVFLTNTEYQVCMMNGNKLDSFYSCPQCGEEGFYNDVRLPEHRKNSKECNDWLKDIWRGRK